MYKYACLIICMVCFFCSGCEEKAAAPPPKPNIVSKKIDLTTKGKDVRAVAASGTASSLDKPKGSTAPAGGAVLKTGQVSETPGVRAPLADAAALQVAGAPPTTPPVTTSSAKTSSDGQMTADDIDMSDKELQDILNTAGGTDGDVLKKPSGYSAKSKIDPFEPLFKPKPADKPAPSAAKEKQTVPTRRLTPLEKVDLDQLKLVGIVRAASGDKALVEDASGKGYIVIRGTYMGIHSGQVVDILKDRIVVEEEDNDVLGNKRVHKRELKFQRPSGDEIL